MSDQKKWKHGSVEFPLETATTNSLLRDVDPALYYALQLFEHAIGTYVGERLLAQFALHGFDFPSAVVKTLAYEPSPFLLADQMEFPLLCVYRSAEEFNPRVVHLPETTATWEWAYILPPLGTAETEALHPILRAVAIVMREFAARSWDPGYEDGRTLRDLSGIRGMLPGPVRYGNFEAVDKLDKFWRAVTGKLFVTERDDVVASAFETFDGANINIDHVEADGTSIADFVQVETRPAPVLEEVAPSAGTSSGGAVVELIGRNFRLGTTPRVLFGGAYADSVRVTHPTRIVCTTPEHAAQPSLAVDVQIIDADGAESNVLEAAYTFTS